MTGSEALAGLRVVQKRVYSIDSVLGLDVPALRGLPVLLESSPDIGITINAGHPSTSQDP